MLTLLPPLVRKSLPSKVAADKEGQLVLMCYSDVGCAAGANPILFWPGLLLLPGDLTTTHATPRVVHAPRSELNKVVELWRYPDATACMAAREGARKATSWKAAIARVAPMVQVRCAALRVA